MKLKAIIFIVMIMIVVFGATGCGVNNDEETKQQVTIEDVSDFQNELKAFMGY